ncbi:MAG TPA: hypothetical protein VNH11_26390 [Pirellulales bacterium]|nr:hypothetical protein [Pirellulales bacterium]
MTRIHYLAVVCVLAGLATMSGRADAGAMRGCGACCAPCAPCVQYDVVYDVREVQCLRTVYETAYRSCTFTQCRPVYETVYQECPDTVCRMVYETVEKPVTCTVMKPVYSTVQRPVCRVVCEPVTKWCTYCVDMGHWERPAAADGCCAPCQVWVPNVVQKRVPVTHYVARTVTETVPMQVCSLVPQVVTKVCRYPVCRMVQENIVRRIPRITCRVVSEQVTKQVPYTVCRQVPYTVKIRVPRCVPRPCASNCGTSPAPAPRQADVERRALEALGRVA